MTCRLIGTTPTGAVIKFGMSSFCQAHQLGWPKTKPKDDV